MRNAREVFIIVSLLDVVLLLFALGYALRFYLDVIAATLAETGRAPNPPEALFGRSYGTACRGLLLMLVYVTPVVTLPLLPLGLLALAHTGDERGLDVRWALRAARKHAGKLLLIWAPLGLWTVLLAMWLIFLASLSRKDVSTTWIAVLVVVAPGVNHLLVCAVFRCVGLLVRSAPDLLDFLPERLDRDVMLLSVGIALGANCLLWGVVYLLHQ